MSDNFKTVGLIGKFANVEIGEDIRALGQFLLDRNLKVAVDKGTAESVKYSGNVEAAKLVGKQIAEKALAHDIKQVVFDRNGFLYHGRVKALADAAREAGLTF